MHSTTFTSALRLARRRAGRASALVVAGSLGSAAELVDAAYAAVASVPDAFAAPALAEIDAVAEALAARSADAAAARARYEVGAL